MLDVAVFLPDEGIDMRGLVKAIESSLMDQALDRSNGSRLEAAKLLGLHRTTLVMKLKKRRLLQVKSGLAQ